jgi:hypothetical protein
VARNDFFDNRIARTVEMAMCIVQELIVLDQRLPKLQVAHQRDVDDQLVLVQELVLTQDTQPQSIGDRYRAGAGLVVPAQNVEQRRLAGTIGADQPIPLTCVELERCVREQRAIAVGLAEA